MLSNKSTHGTRFCGQFEMGEELINKSRLSGTAGPMLYCNRILFFSESVNDVSVSYSNKIVFKRK